MSQKIECEKSGKTVIITPLSARKLKLTPMYKGAEIVDEKGNLVGLDFDGDFEVKNGNIVPVQRQKYRIKSIDRMMTKDGYCCGYFLNTSELNKSSMFLLPFLGYNRAWFRWNNEFMNCFIKTEEDDTEGFLYLWYKYIPSLEMEAFETKIKLHPEYVESVDTDEYHVLYKFSIPKKFLDDYNLILEGKYSYISEVGKERILNFNASSKERPLGKILFRDPSRRKEMEKELQVKIPESQDLYDPLYQQDEYFFNKYKIPKSKL